MFPGIWRRRVCWSRGDARCCGVDGRVGLLIGGPWGIWAFAGVVWAARRRVWGRRVWGIMAIGDGRWLECGAAAGDGGCCWTAWVAVVGERGGGGVMGFNPSGFEIWAKMGG
ncbi:hypothetical protein ACLOJK_025978 [Asimina triloba]